MVKKCWKHCILVSVFGMVYVIVYLSLLITYHCICICAVVLQMSFYVLWKKFYTDFVFFYYFRLFLSLLTYVTSGYSYFD